MDLNVYIQLIFLCVVNIIFTFSGIILNTLVIASFWKSSQLRNKLSHFMVMVLSWFDLVSVVVSHPRLLFYLISWLSEDYDLLLNTWWTYLHFVSVILGFSFYVLLVMSIERYLGAYYPVFHRTSVTRRRLLTLLAILLISHTTLYAISTKDLIIPRNVVSVICIIAVFPPLAYLNFILFKITRVVRGKNTISPEKRTAINLKSISTCLLVVVSLVALSIPFSVHIVFNMNTGNKEASIVMLSRI